MFNCRRAALFLALLGLSACGGGGGGGGTSPVSNMPPTPNFAYSCADLVCTFTSTSTDQDLGDAVTTYNWNFGDATAAATTANPTHTFASGRTYDVTLVVGDRFGATSTAIRQVVVTAPPAPAAPHASFTASCVSLDCTFDDTTTFDPGSVFQSRVWDFGDNTTLATDPAVHTYAATALRSFTVKLTVMDQAGKSSSSVKTISVAPPATTLNCTGGSCSLTLTQASRVSATLVSRSCAATNNRVLLTAPVAQTVFDDGCVDPVGTVVPINGGSLFAAGATLQVAVLSGSLPAASLTFTPSIRVTGDFASGWTLTFDDGYGGPGEPDFNDLVILIRATP
jgi:PKD repeat protein